MKDPLLHHVLGPYRLTRVVGRGGMGTVYAAEALEAVPGQTQALGTGPDSAVKVLSPPLAADPDFRERFQAEIESLKQLHHPHIVQMYGFGEQDGYLYYSMELIQGNSLQEELRQGRHFTWREVTRMAIDICGALKHAHDHGVIHRDLKPANLLLTPDEQVKLLDFGIAKLFGASGATSDSVLGTADYMAPEQAEGLPVSPCTDLYSLGCVMYALLAGKPPFTGKSIPEVVHKLRYESAVPIRRLVPEVPLELELLIDKLLEKKPANRIRTALMASHQLRAVEQALSLPAGATGVGEDTANTRASGDTHGRNSDEDLSDATATTRRLPVSGELLPQRPTRPLHDVLDDTDQFDDVTVITSNEDLIRASKDHFTAVDPNRPTETASGFNQDSFFRVSMLLLALLGLGGLGWYFSLPPTANELHSRIDAQRNEDDRRQLLEVEPEIRRFLELYPDDPRAEEVTGLREEIEAMRLQRQLQTKAQRNSKARSELERMFLEAVREIPRDPAEATRRLERLLELYPDDAPATRGYDRQVLRVIRQQIDDLKEQREARDEETRRLLLDRLQEATKLTASNPASARRIYEAIVELAADNPYLLRLKEDAEKELKRLPAPSASIKPR
jgi:serine/threonine-protein kinase